MEAKKDIGLTLPFPGGPASVGPESVTLPGGRAVPIGELASAAVGFAWRGWLPAWEASVGGAVFAKTANPFGAWAWRGWPEFAKYLSGLRESGSRLARLAAFAKASASRQAAYLTTRDLEFAQAGWDAAAAAGKRALAALPALLGAPAVRRPDEALRSSLNAAFLERESAAWAGFLDTVEKNPLTPEQRRVVLENDHRVQVVAAAGSGKTSTVVAKVAYLVKSGFAKPSEILVLAFNKKAAEEVSQRMQSRLGFSADVQTFHGLGLGLVGAITGRKPRLHRAAENDGMGAFIAGILVRLAENGAWPLICRVLAVDQAQESEMAETISAASAAAPASSRARSPQEEELCGLFDFLKRSGAVADWAYEPDYEHDTRDRRHGQYRPDFSITIAGKLRPVYWEHFALAEDGTSAFGQDYVESAKWKRELHAKHGTKLVESHSWWWKGAGGWAARALSALESAGAALPAFAAADAIVMEALKAAADNSKRPREKDDRDWKERREAELDPLDPGTRQRAVARLLEVIGRAVSIMRERGLSKIPRPLPGYVEALALTIDMVAEAYASEMDPAAGETDFPAMVAEAARLLPSAADPAVPWKAVLVDEFQDVSHGRFGLVRAILGRLPEARLTCVGDDWQSIYRFTGADVGIMTGLSREVGHPVHRIDITTTFRSAQGIVDVASAFVQKNPGQMRKSVRGSRGGLAKPVAVVSTDEVGGTPGKSPVDVALSSISSVFPAAKSVFVLSRYNRGIPDEESRGEIRGRHPSFAIEWMTIHKSKGLEADAVLVTGLFEGNTGFPAKREEHAVLRALLARADAVEFAEERRLFYVALTRAKGLCVLLCPTTNPSRFAAELLNDHPDKVAHVVDGVLGCKRCPKCAKGYVVAADGGFGRFFRCNNWPACDHKESSCPRCSVGMLIRGTRGTACSSPECGYSARKCPRCGRGDLALRRRRSDGKPFMGCKMYFDEARPCTYTEAATRSDLAQPVPRPAKTAGDVLAEFKGKVAAFPAAANGKKRLSDEDLAGDGLEAGGDLRVF